MTMVVIRADCAAAAAVNSQARSTPLLEQHHGTQQSTVTTSLQPTWLAKVGPSNDGSPTKRSMSRRPTWYR